MANEALADIAAKSSPPIAVVTATIGGMDVPALVQWATLIYLAIMIAHKCWRIYKEFKGEAHDGKSAE